MENESLSLSEKDTNQAKALRILSKAKYLSRMAEDESIGEGVRREISKAIYYLYKSAYNLDREGKSKQSWIWLSFMAKEMGLE